MYEFNLKRRPFCFPNSRGVINSLAAINCPGYPYCRGRLEQRRDCFDRPDEAMRLITLNDDACAPVHIITYSREAGFLRRGCDDPYHGVMRPNGCLVQIDEVDSQRCVCREDQWVCEQVAGVAPDAAEGGDERGH
jgi:hypothetical protein